MKVFWKLFFLKLKVEKMFAPFTFCLPLAKGLVFLGGAPFWGVFFKSGAAAFFGVIVLEALFGFQMAPPEQAFRNLFGRDMLMMFLFISGAKKN